MESMRCVIAITGCTGTGKTKLGVELAKRYNGEVISADSMQIYEGLNIITNKVTNEEADGVCHHCVSYVNPNEQYNVTKYVKHALPIIDDIIERGKTAIIVGGTAYYIEALLWDFTLSLDQQFGRKTITSDNLQILDSDNLSDYEKLQKIDPQTATQLHPNNNRKIERSLEIYRQFGVCHSELLEQQHIDSHNVRGRLRWDSVLLFSMECDQDVLDKRLDSRVDKMVELGLCHEINTFSDLPQENSGLLEQAIGYKEFEKYIALKKTTSDLENAFNEGLEKMKVTTRRYSRKQLRWINHRLRDTAQPNYTFVKLDTTNPELWGQDISKPAHLMVDEFLAGTLDTVCDSKSAAKRSVKVAHTCEICDVTCVGDNAFSDHMTSRKHKRRKEYLKQKPAIEEYISNLKITKNSNF